MTLVIGLVGEKGSGKQTFTDFLKEIVLRQAQDKTVKQIKFSDLLVETLNAWHLPLTRANTQKMAIVMNEGFGEGTLTHAIEQRIAKESADIVVLDGVRWLTDPEMIRKFPHNLLVYITAEAKIRYERLKNRGEKIDEKNLSFDQFMQEETAKTETFIPQIGATADIKLDNNGSLEELKQEVVKLNYLLK